MIAASSLRAVAAASVLGVVALSSSAVPLAPDRAVEVPAAAGRVTADGRALAARDYDECNDRRHLLFDQGLSPQLEAYDARAIWRHATGAGVLVAVVDSGLNVANVHLDPRQHPGVVASGTSFLPDVNDEFDPDPYNPAGLVDASGHGTAVAGIIAARPVRGSGVYGLAAHATLLPVQVFADDGAKADQRLVPKSSRIAQGITWAADHGAKVINVSLSASEDHPDLRAAVVHAQARGALVVASAGNRETAKDKSDGLRYPAAYPGVLGVTALNANGEVDESSIHGPQVDIAAPGQAVASTFNQYADCIISPSSAQASFATPMVSAAAALLAQRYPHEGPQMWAYRLMASARRPVASQRDDRSGWGAMQPYDALVMTVDPHRAGPALPEHRPAPPKAVPAPVSVAGPRPDPLGPARGQAVWVVLAGAVAALVLGLARRLAGRD